MSADRRPPKQCPLITGRQVLFTSTTPTFIYIEAIFYLFMFESAYSHNSFWTWCKLPCPADILFTLVFLKTLKHMCNKWTGQDVMVNLHTVPCFMVVVFTKGIVINRIRYWNIAYTQLTVASRLKAVQNNVIESVCIHSNLELLGTARLWSFTVILHQGAT